MITPPSCVPSASLFFIIGRATARVKRNVPFRLTFSTASQSASLMRMRRPSFVMPALFTRMSTVPNASMTRFTHASTSALSATLQPSARAVEPAASTRSTVSRHQSSWRSTTATLAPASASFFAICWPMPRPAPVTMATLPSKLPISNSYSFLNDLTVRTQLRPASPDRRR